MANTQPTQGTTVQNPQPSTTAQAPGGPFIQHTFRGNSPMYTVAPAFGATVTTSLVPVSGYARRFRVKVNATGGTSTGACTVSPDAPYDIIQQVLLNDPQGNTILNLPGFEALRLVPMISGSFGLWRYADVMSQPSYAGVQTTTGAGNGNFQFQSWIPLEFAEAVGVLGLDNASVLPSFTWTVAGASTLYGTTSPVTLPTLGLEVDVDFYWNPDDASILPPGLGSSRQWKLLSGTPSVTSGASGFVTCPKFGGGYLDSITLVARNASNVRTDVAWPNRIQLMIDGTVLVNETIDQLVSDMYNAYQLPSNADPSYSNGIWTPVTATGSNEVAGTRPIGVLTIPLKNNISQVITGLDDSGRSYISTTPGTNLQLSGTGWNGTASINFIPGLVVPAGTLVTGQPEV